MRNTAQRTKAALLGAKRLKQKQAKRRMQAMMVGCYGLSISIVLALSFVVASFGDVGLETGMGDAATAYTGSLFAFSSLGYITIAAFSFILGVCATVLSLLLRKKYQEEGVEDDEHND